MLRAIFGHSLAAKPCLRSAIRPTPVIKRFGMIESIRMKSSFEELSKATERQDLSKELIENNRNANAINDVESLLASTLDMTDTLNNQGTNDYMLQNSLKHPRDVAKSIKLTGPMAGRTVDVHHGNLGRALANLNSLIRANKIRYLKKVQARHIPAGKYKKQKKREWWRRKFSQGFKELMAEVRDAKRRGY